MALAINRGSSLATLKVVKSLFPVLCGSVLAASCLAKDEGARQVQVFLERIVVVDGEKTYPDPLVLNRADRTEIPESLIGAASRLAAIVPLEFTASSKAKATELCGFATSEEWAHDFQKCSEAMCTTLPIESQELTCGYLIRVNEWVEETWLGGLCRITHTNRNKSPLVSWFLERKLTECFQMSEAIAAAFYRHAAGLPVSESSLIERVR
jgi:hypothetical protein